MRTLEGLRARRSVEKELVVIASVHRLQPVDTYCIGTATMVDDNRGTLTRHVGVLFHHAAHLAKRQQVQVLLLLRSHA